MNKLLALMIAMSLCACMDVEKHCKEQTQIDYNACVVMLRN